MPSFYARRGVCVLSVSRYITHLALSCGRGSDKSCSQQKDKKRIYRFQKGAPIAEGYSVFCRTPVPPRGWEKPEMGERFMVLGDL
ncbi:hypothetical protein CDAR_471991 [Caerostris darwini]|uniref:Secreted protein n=1 Tax=Caerostris darwini TaxID=1538125 RepID=A0AAV4VL96_9ARAC|nr:hypothetical protein CDAR_471991 [Caerostris darwini]